MKARHCMYIIRIKVANYFLTISKILIFIYILIIQFNIPNNNIYSVELRRHYVNSHIR